MSQDKDAMEKAAIEYVGDLNQTPLYREEIAFREGWQAAHQGPKVMALVEALKRLKFDSAQGFSAALTHDSISSVVNEALAEFEGEK